MKTFFGRSLEGTERNNATRGALHVAVNAIGNIETESWCNRIVRAAVKQRFSERTLR